MKLVLVDDGGKVCTVISNINGYDLKRPIAQAAICNKIHDEMIKIAVKQIRNS